MVGERVVNTLGNRFELEGDNRIAEYFRTKHSLLGEALRWGSSLFVGVLREIVQEALKFMGRPSASPAAAAHLDEYTHLFQAIGLPPVPFGLESDAMFAVMRLAGPNPLMLQRVSHLDDRFPVTEAIYQAVVPGDTLAAAAAEARLYLADYFALDGAELGVFPHDRQKYVYAPLALFVVDKRTRELRPVAVQCKQVPGPDNPVFTPDDGVNWLMAKTIVEIADGNYHETVSHLGRTHLLIEPFVICTYRQLAPAHPLFQLLAPHFEGTLAINDAAWRHLIANKGAVDKLCAVTLKGAQRLTADGVRTCLFNEAMLPKALKARGVDDTAALPSYAYRDDAMPYWDAIREWVADYLPLYYASDADVAADPELTAWMTEISAEQGGRVRGFGPAGAEPTLAYLIDAVTMVIYTCSVQHAAVNFPQYDVMSYTPAMPLAGYAPAPTTKKGGTEADFLAMLPPVDMAELQMELGYILGTVHYTTLGQYPANYFTDPRVFAPLARFQARLADIDATIADRNQTRRYYPYLKLEGIPQSINI